MCAGSLCIRKKIIARCKKGLCVCARVCVGASAGGCIKRTANIGGDGTDDSRRSEELPTLPQT